MDCSSDARNGAMEFERIVRGQFEDLGYEVMDRPAADWGGDFLLHKEEFPIDLKILVDVKFFGQSLVSAASVAQVLNAGRQISADRAIIVTTYGFTAEAHKLAEGTEGFVTLLSEADLLARLPAGRRRTYLRELDRLEFFPNLASLFPSVDSLLTYTRNIPKGRLSALLQEALDPYELIELVMERVPPEVLLREVLSVLEPSEQTRIFEEVARQWVIPVEDKNAIRDAYAAALKATDSNEKGRLLEGVVRDLISLVPGLKVVGSNIDDGMEEIDLQVRNLRREHVWAEFDGTIFVECKNWTKRVNADAVRSFKVKLEQSGLHSGLLVAVNGVTGNGLKGAWGVIKTQLQQGYKIVVLDGSDINSILDCADVSETVDKKYTMLYQIGSPNSGL